MVKGSSVGRGGGAFSRSALVCLCACNDPIPPAPYGMLRVPSDEDEEEEGSWEISSDDSESAAASGEGEAGDGDGDGDGESAASEETGDVEVSCEIGFSSLVLGENAFDTRVESYGDYACETELTITVLGGQVCMQDDLEGGYFYTIESLAFADVEPQSCDDISIGLMEFRIVDVGEGTDVRVPQAGGPMQGQQAIVILASAYGSAPGLGDFPPTIPLPFEGLLPEGEVLFEPGQTTVSFDDPDALIVSGEIDLGLTVQIDFVGFVGSVTLAT